MVFRRVKNTSPFPLRHTRGFSDNIRLSISLIISTGRSVIDYQCFTMASKKAEDANDVVPNYTLPRNFFDVIKEVTEYLAQLVKISEDDLELLRTRTSKYTITCLQNAHKEDNKYASYWYRTAQPLGLSKNTLEEKQRSRVKKLVSRTAWTALVEMQKVGLFDGQHEVKDDIASVKDQLINLSFK